MDVFEVCDNSYLCGSDGEYVELNQELMVRHKDAQAEIAKLKNADSVQKRLLDEKIDDCVKWMEDCDELQCRVERLRGYLKSIASNACCDTCQEAALVAKSGLNSVLEKE